MSVQATLEHLRAARVVAVVRAASASDAVEVAAALAEGGIEAVELTYSTPELPRALRETRARLGSDVLLGAGTLTEPHHAREAADAGAAFVVSPHLDPRLLEAMLETGLPALPGVLTPSEAAAATAQGAPAVKLFPAATVGPQHLRALHAPFPSLKVVPTGGIGAANAAAWLAAGAWAVGVGGELAPSSVGDEAARSALVARAQALLASLA
jgi:2-dehydro-3-deoxyphosphogluconate aldolase/(4S)-4-hydroxy-2-oxoglutarate aldolase